MISSLILSAFLMGLVGSLHCIGMCGGIVSSMTMNLPLQKKHTQFTLQLYLINYNAGRILSYGLAGLIVGIFSSFTYGFFDDSLTLSHIISGLFMILFGLYISQLWKGLGYLEKLASPFWKLIQPLSKNYLPPSSPLRAFPLGLIWGWLPCGFVYSALPIAYSTGDVLQSFLVMVAFGLGTLPMLLMAGNMASSLKSTFQNRNIRLILGLMFIAWGAMLMTGIISTHEMHAH